MFFIEPPVLPKKLPQLLDIAMVSLQSRNFTPFLPRKFSSTMDRVSESERLGRMMPKVKLNDVEIYYEEHGKGRPMVFLSETACDGEVWKINQVEEFSRDHRVIIHDYRGTGQSSKPSIDYTTTMFAEDVVALMDHLKAEDAIIVGHSMGGRVAQLLALDHPKKVHKLVLASTGRPLSADQRLAAKDLQGNDRMGLREIRTGSYHLGRLDR